MEPDPTFASVDSARPICVCASGDPRAPRTWSGTPRSICSELERRGLLGATFDTDGFGRPHLTTLAKATGKLYYTGSKYVGHGVIQHLLRARTVSAACRRLNCDVLLHMGTVAVPRERDVSRTRHYVFVDSTWKLWTSMSTDRARISRRLYRDAERLESEALRGAAHVLTTAEYVRASVVEDYGVPQENVSVVGTGRGSLVLDASEKDYANGVILFVAKERFHDKGGHILVEAFQQARRQNPRLTLVMAGSDAHRACIPQVDGIEVYGFVSFEELQALFRRAALFALPALNEPWGLVYLESLACGVPVLGLNRNALPELTGYGAYGFYADETPTAVAETILRAFEDPAALARMGSAGREHCLRTFTWEKTVDRMLAAIARTEGVTT